MLEQAALLLLPWEMTANGGRTRGVLDAATKVALGRARFVSRWGPEWLRRWLPPRLEIVETEDESLLCLVHRGWGRWSAADAEGRLVGQVRGDLLIDARGQVVARWKQINPSGLVQFMTPAGVELATLERAVNGLRLTFATWLADDPYAKMLLLAAALTSDWSFR